MSASKFALAVGLLGLPLLATPAFADGAIPLTQGLEQQEFYCGLALGATKVVSQQSSHLTVDCLSVFNQGIAFGFYVSTLGSQHIGAEDYHLKDVSLWHAGLSAGWQQAIAGPLLARGVLNAGYGQFNFRDNQKEDPQTEVAGVIILSPEIGVFIQVTDDTRFGLTTSYRSATKPDMPEGLTVSAKDISGLVVGAELSLNLN